MASVQSIDRALAVLNETALRPGGLSDLARRADLPTSTASRLLATLEAAGTVTRDEDGIYRIGPAIVAMARSVGAMPEAPPLEIAARRHLGELADSSGEAAGLCVPIGDEIHTIAQLDAPKSVQVENWTGHSWPAHQGGSGIVVLSTLSLEAFEAYLGRRSLTGEAADRVRRRVRQASLDGCCWSHGDYTEDLSSVAAPVLDQTGSAIAALYVYGPNYRFPGHDTATIASLVIEQAADLSRTVGLSW